MFKKMLNKSIFLGLIIGLTLAAVTTYAWNSVWNGTSWITSGGVIDAQKIAENFEYLKAQGGIWLLSGSNAYYNGGNVGIGTASPSYKLNVNGDTLVNGWLRTTGNTGWYSNTHGGGWYMSDATWVRSYANKSVYTGGQIRGDGGLCIGGDCRTSWPSVTKVSCYISGNPEYCTATCPSGYYLTGCVAGMPYKSGSLNGSNGCWFAAGNSYDHFYGHALCMR
jgi:hypothetical protein